MKECIFIGLKNRLFQILARVSPGASSMRVLLHKWRGVRMGKEVWIGYDTIIETAHPYFVCIGNNVTIGMRVIIIAHFDYDKSTNMNKDMNNISIIIEDDTFIGPGTIILPNVTIGHGAVVTAGSVVTRSIPPMTMVQGNPAKPIATCGVPLTTSTPMSEFKKKLKPLRKNQSKDISMS